MSGRERKDERKVKGCEREAKKRKSEMRDKK